MGQPLNPVEILPDNAKFVTTVCVFKHQGGLSEASTGEPLTTNNTGVTKNRDLLKTQEGM